MDGTWMAACALGMTSHCSHRALAPATRQGRRCCAFREAILHVLVFVKGTATSWPLTPDSHRTIDPHSSCQRHSIFFIWTIVCRARSRNEQPINTTPRLKDPLTITPSHLSILLLLHVCDLAEQHLVSGVTRRVGNQGDWCCQSFVILREFRTEF